MRWEYKTVKFDNCRRWTGSLDLGLLNEQLNLLGRDGWELVQLTPTSPYGGGTMAIFKRQK